MTRQDGRKVTEVAVGVLLRADGAVLLADRPAGKPYPGYWEFPGGKIEQGENVGAALARELHEELGITIGASVPWVTFEFSYPHAYVRLHFERVYEWQGTPHAREGQRLDFYLPGAALPAPLLPAAVPALRWLLLPDLLHFEPYRCELGPLLDPSALRVARPRTSEEWIGAFAAERSDLEKAAELKCDFVFVGPIHADENWSEWAPIGWGGFAEIARETPLPVFAFGGLVASELARARQHGAHGIAQSVPA